MGDRSLLEVERLVHLTNEEVATLNRADPSSAHVRRSVRSFHTALAIGSSAVEGF
jgi:hypothetical protein